MGLKYIRGNDSSLVTTCKSTVTQKFGHNHSLWLLESLQEARQVRELMAHCYKHRHQVSDEDLMWAAC